MKSRIASAAAALVALDAVGAAAGRASDAEAAEDGVRVRERTQEFNVYGDDYRAAVAGIRRYGARRFGKPNHLAHTQISWDWRAQARGLSFTCSIREATVTLDLTYVLPNWVGARAASPADRSRWRALYRRADVHERIHGDIAKAMAREVHHLIVTTPPAKDCDTVLEDAKTAADDYIAKTRAQEAFDEYAYGRKDGGASFNVIEATRRR